MIQTHPIDHDESLCRNTKELIKGYFCILLEEWEQMPLWLKEGDISNRLVIMTQPFGYMIYCRVLLKEKQYQKLLGAGDIFLQISSIFPNLLPKIHIWIAMAIAWEQLGDSLKASECMDKALLSATPDKIWIPFAEQYTEIRDMLNRAVIKDANVLKTIKRLATGLEKGKAAYKGKEVNKGNSLTARELEVANMAKQRMSTKEISQKLHISEKTVNNTLGRIYSKLGIHSKNEL